MNINDIKKKLWEAADTLRGNLSSEEYMHIILGVLSLKYISDTFDKVMEKEKINLKNITSSEFYNNFETFIVGKISHWNYIMSFANSIQIGQVIDDAFIALEKKNPLLKNIFNKNYNREGLDQNKLGELIKIFSLKGFSFEKEDIVGRIYEFFLGKFFKDRGQKGGEFYTPTSIVELMVNIIKPIKGTIYDPACGTGGILVQSKRYIEEHDGDFLDITAYGQEYNRTTWNLARLNLLLNGFPLQDLDDNFVLGNKSADTFTEDLHKNLKFDFIMANPPFNMKKWNQEKLLDDSRWQWGVPPKNNANYAWLSHMLTKLSVKGKAAIVLANVSLTSMKKEEKEIRKNFIEKNKIIGIIALPPKLFYTTQISAVIWILDNNKKSNKILFVDSTTYGSSLDGSKKNNELKKSKINTISKIFKKFKETNDINIPGIAKSINITEIKNNDYWLLPSIYLDIKENEQKNPLEIKKELKKNVKELKVLLKESSKLESKLKNVIKKLNL